jgi:hypothetical protein
MKKNLIGLVLAGFLLVAGMVLSSCVEFMDGFAEGWQYGRSLSYDSGDILDRDILQKDQ